MLLPNAVLKSAVLKSVIPKSAIPKSVICKATQNSHTVGFYRVMYLSLPHDANCDAN